MNPMNASLLVPGDSGVAAAAFDLDRSAPPGLEGARKLSSRRLPDPVSVRDPDRPLQAMLNRFIRCDRLDACVVRQSRQE